MILHEGSKDAVIKAFEILDDHELRSSAPYAVHSRTSRPFEDTAKAPKVLATSARRVDVFGNWAISASTYMKFNCSSIFQKLIVSSSIVTVRKETFDDTVDLSRKKGISA